MEYIYIYMCIRNMLMELLKDNMLFELLLRLNKIYVEINFSFITYDEH